MNDPIVIKAKRRIKRFIKDPTKHQARVYPIRGGLFEYKVKHYVRSLVFKADKLGRLRLLA